jgi:hypothetical protein
METDSERVIAKEDLVLVRPGTQADESFIFATWLQGLRHGNELYKLIEADTYYRQYHRVIESILNAPGVKVSVACLKESPDVILGYAVHRGDALHWVHVKKAWRGIGIAKSLAPPNLKTVTHVNRLGVSYVNNHPGLVFNPFAIP